MAKYSSGIKSISMGAIAADGGMGTTLTSVGDIFLGSAIFEEAEDAITDFYSELQDDPILSVGVNGLKTLTFTLVDVTPAQAILFLGGTATGTTPTLRYGAPLTFVTIEQSLQILTKEGYTIQIPRAKINARLLWSFSKTDMAKIEVKARVLMPTKAGVEPYAWTLA